MGGESQPKKRERKKWPKRKEKRKIPVEKASLRSLPDRFTRALTTGRWTGSRYRNKKPDLPASGPAHRVSDPVIREYEWLSLQLITGRQLGICRA